MIFKPVKFEVVYKVGEEFRREAVLELLCTPSFGVTSIKTVSNLEVAVDPVNVALLQFTGQFDKDGAEVYHGHLLANTKGDIFEVVAYSAGFHLQYGEDMPLELNDANLMTLKIVGDSITNSNLLMPIDPEAIMAESAKRKILPPLVTLKKKVDSESK